MEKCNWEKEIVYDFVFSIICKMFFRVIIKFFVCKVILIVLRIYLLID